MARSRRTTNWRHGRACHRKSGLPGLRRFKTSELGQARVPVPSTSSPEAKKTWMPAPSAGMTEERVLRFSRHALGAQGGGGTGPVEALRRQREDFDAVLGHRHRVL